MSLTKMMRNLQAELAGEITDKFIEALLYGMKLSFDMSSGYRLNIEHFRGRYVFRSADGLVNAAAAFDGGDMKVYDSALEDWNARVTFKDAGAFRRFLFSKDQDILNSLLANDVEVEGNLNYIYKFGFMARELLLRLGVM